ncbi:MAG: hypothetical protein WA081_12560 [Desulfosalsimonadaceae bacterium]
MQNIYNILNDKEFESFLTSKKEFARFESMILDGHLSFIKSCTIALKQYAEKFADNDLISLLYLLKYIFNSWTLSDKETRTKKAICLRVLFLALMTEKSLNDRRLVLQKTIDLIDQSWFLTHKDFPFLLQKEKEKISSEISIIISEKKLLKNLSSIKFDDHLNSNSYPFLLPETAKRINGLYSKFYQVPEQLKNNDEGLYVKTVFSGILESKLTLDFPGVLSCLPLCYLCDEVEKALNSIIPSTTLQNKSALSSFKISDSCYPKKKLFIKDAEGVLQPLPFWATWFCDAGAKVASISQNTQNLVVGFSLPTRAYALLFFLLGYETWIAKQAKNEPASYRAYFDLIASCEKECSLLILENERWKRCFFEGLEIIGSDRLLRVKVQGTENKKHSSMIPENHIFKIRFAVDPARKVGNRQVGFSMKDHYFLMAYYEISDQELLKYLVTGNSSYAVVGAKSTIEKEIHNIKLFVGATEGSFQDILRFNIFMSEFTFPKGKILSSRKSVEKCSPPPHLLIFDGSREFLNFQGRVKSPVEIILLDRSEAHFADARDELMNRYYNRETDMVLFEDTPEPIEIIIFKE